MCLTIHSDRHLDILLFYEQNWPYLTKAGRLMFVECYDIILRNYSLNAVDKLYMLSLYRPNKKQLIYDFVDYADTRPFDWIFTKHVQEQIQEDDEESSIHHLALPSASYGGDILEYKASMLTPIMTLPAWMKQEEGVSSFFWGTGMTFGEVKFKDDKVIEPFDPKREAQTTYWMRICIKPKVKFYIIEPCITFGPSKGAMVNVQPCIGLCPNTVLDFLGDRIAYGGRDDLYHDEAIGLANHMKAFGSSGTSTLVAQHRVALVTSRKFLVINPSFSGACSYAGMRTTSAKTAHQKNVARCWEAGYDKLKKGAQVGMAANIYYHLATHYPNIIESQTAPQIAAIVSPGDDHNVSHTCEALVKTGFLKKEQVENQKQPVYYPDKNFGEIYGPVLFDQKKTLENKAMREKYIQLLDLLYGYVEAATENKTITQLKRSHFTIQYELVSPKSG